MAEEEDDVAVKPETDVIDELLRQDEEELKAKKKRLRDFQSAVTTLRAATSEAEKAAAEILQAGDLSRSDLGRVFNLTRAERAIAVPAQARSAGVADAVDEQADAANDAADEQAD